MTNADMAKLRVALDFHQTLIAQAESFRAAVLEPQILKLAAKLSADNEEGALIEGDEHKYIIDRRGRVMTRKKG